MQSQFDHNEFRDILIAWLVLTFVIGLRAFLTLDLEAIAAVFIATGTAFIFHEMGHKFSAIHYHYIAHFRLWIAGIVLILLTGLASSLAGGGFIFGAPGATYIEASAIGYGLGYYSRNYRTQNENESALIAATGPASNLAFTVLFYFLSYFTPGTQYAFLNLIGEYGFGLNLGLGAFNMLPVPPLDGYKIFRKNILLGLALALPLWLAFLFRMVG